MMQQLLDTRIVEVSGQAKDYDKFSAGILRTSASALQKNLPKPEKMNSKFSLMQKNMPHQLRLSTRSGFSSG
jgi:hypothetical protein